MDAAITELYRVFKPYRLGEDFCGCGDCVAPRDSELLASKPLADLDVSDLNRYAFKALTTWGTERHFKHFLPRLLELTLDKYLAFDFPEVIFEKLTYAKWSTWPNVETNAIRSFLVAFWKHHLLLAGDFPTDDRIRTVLGGLAEACESLNLFLDIWAETKTECSALHLAQLIDGSADDLMTTGRIRLWGDSTRQCDEIKQWMLTEKVGNLLLIFRESILTTFPLVLNQLDGIRAAISPA